MGEKMSPKERLFARLNGDNVDYLPNTNIIMLFSAKENKVSYKDYVTEYKKLVDCDIKTSRKYGLDLLCTISDPVREASAFGAQVIFPENDVPFCPVPLLSNINQSEKLKVSDPSTKERLSDRVEGVRLFKKIVGNEYPVAGWVEGAFAECCDLRGINEFFIDLYEEEPDKLHTLLKICNEQAIKFAISQIDAGADIIGIGDAACSLISKEMYEEFALPYQISLIDAIHSKNAKTKLHICGNTTALLDCFIKTKTDIIDIDWQVDLKYAAQKFVGTKIAISGNFNPVADLMQSTPEQIDKTIRKCVSVGDNHYLVSAGCEVPPSTNSANLMQIHKTIVQIGKR